MKAISTHSIDTNKQVKAFKKAGLGENLSELIVEYVSKSREYDLSKFATKNDLNLVKIQLTNKIDSVDKRLGAKIDSVEERLGAKINSVEERLGAKIDIIDNKIVTQIETAKNEMLRWVIALLVSIIITGLGIILTMIFK